MSVKDTVMGMLRDHFADDDSDKVLELMGGISDALDSQKENDDWQKKYEELDKSWRKKYKDRFFSNPETENDSKENDLYEDKFDEDEARKQHKKENPEFEDIFRPKTN